MTNYYDQRCKKIIKIKKKLQHALHIVIMYNLIAYKIARILNKTLEISDQKQKNAYHQLRSEKQLICTIFRTN